ncbi:MAG: AraC family transcriptional regulator [Kiritimatiellae bacterium]|nr:AraC family transcriptional regulator [Kiritimatiellia bacterium]
MKKVSFQYFVPDLPQKRLGSYITVAGQEVFGKGDVFPSALHNSYYSSVGEGRRLEGKEHQILYIRSGKGKLEFEGGKGVLLKAGSVTILRPGEWHRYKPDQTSDWSEAYIGLGGDMVEHVVRELFPKPDPIVLDLSSDTRFDASMMALVDEILSDGVGKPHSLAMKVLSLIASLVERAHDSKSAPTSYMAIRRASLYIAHHLDETLDLESLAKRFGMGYSFFRRRFRIYTGLSPLAYQLSLRMRRAKRLLKGTDAPISEIAKSLGFRSQAYFARFFRKETGQSPRSYRADVAKS